MDQIKVRNWDKWQTYRKDRGQPPWIKVHRCLMRNPEWVSLTDAERGQLVAIWLLAADRDGVIPASREVIERLCYMTTKLNLNKFISLGFLSSSGCLDGVAVASSGCHCDDADTDTETDTETEYILSAKPTAKQADEVEFAVEEDPRETENPVTKRSEPFFITKKKRKLKGTQLERFEKFWKVFDYKKGKAEAADAWFDLPDKTGAVFDRILFGAEYEARARPRIIKAGRTPKMAQGWLSSRRWEDDFSVNYEDSEENEKRRFLEGS